MKFLLQSEILTIRPLTPQPDFPVKWWAPQHSHIPPKVRYRLNTCVRCMVVCLLLGAINSTKISGNFGPKLNGSVRSNGKSFEKTGPPFEVVLFCRSDRSEFWLNGSRPLLLLLHEITWSVKFIFYWQRLGIFLSLCRRTFSLKDFWPHISSWSRC